MTTADVLVSTTVMGSLLLVITVFIQRACNWYGYTVAVSNSGVSTSVTYPPAVPSEANKSDPIHPSRVILEVVLLVGVITALIEITTTTDFFMAVGIVAFCVPVYLGLVTVTTSRVIRT